METRIYDFQVRLLVTRDGDQYVAHALEMDLVAYGDTEKEALDEISNMMRNQISFALQKKEMRLTDFKAPKEYFDLWEKVNAESLQGVVTGKTDEEKCGRIQIITKILVFGKDDIEAIQKRSHKHSKPEFELTPVCA